MATLGWQASPEAAKPSITDHYRVLIYNPVRAKIWDQLSLLYHTTRKSVCLTPSCKRIPRNFRYLSPLLTTSLHENHFPRIFLILLIFLPAYELRSFNELKRREERKKGNGRGRKLNDTETEVYFFLAAPMNFQNGNVFHKTRTFLGTRV